MIDHNNKHLSLPIDFRGESKPSVFKRPTGHLTIPDWPLSKFIPSPVLNFWIILESQIMFIELDLVYIIGIDKVIFLKMKFKLESEE